jgi:hypothetical protein
MCESSPELDGIKLDPDVIKKFMEEHQRNYLYFLTNPYRIRFSINDLSALVDNHIYGLVNLKEEDAKLSRSINPIPDLVGSNHPTKFDWFRLDSGGFPGLGITLGSIVLNPIGSYSRNY